MESLLKNSDKMTSLELAKLANKSHSHLMRDARNMESAWVKTGQSNFGLGSYEDKNNQKRPMYLLSKTECLYIATKYSDEIRAKLILRWEELEKKQTDLSKKDLALMVIESEEEKERLLIQNQAQEKELKIQAPKVEYFNEVLQSNSVYTTNQIAKELGMSARSLNKELHDKRIQYKQNDTWLLYHKYQNKGYTKTKTYSYTGTSGETKTSMNTCWTEQGRLFIHDLFASEYIA